MRSRLERFSVPVCSLAAVVFAPPVSAQIATDGTVGPRLELVGPNYGIRAELGSRAGPHLFHSFERFDLRTLEDGTIEGATFSGPADIANVISRVTGDDQSDINGTLRSTISGADFYFLNPNGVVFGPNARLDVQGSFHVSTADELRFADGAVFSATNPSASSLSVAAPEAFGFLGADAGAITVAGSQLVLPNPGSTLSLSAGALTVENGTSIVANNVALAAQASAGAVPVAVVRPAEARSGLISLGSIVAGPVARVASIGLLLGGSLRIEAGDLLITNAVVGDSHTSAVDSAGGVQIAVDRMAIHGGNTTPGTAIGILTSSLGVGRAGGVRVEASEVSIVGGLIGSVATQADGGHVEIEADHILFAGSANSVGGIGVPASFLGSRASGGATITAHESLTIAQDGQNQ